MILKFYYYHGYSVAVAITMEMTVTWQMDEQAELILLKYLMRHHLISQGITLPPVVIKETTDISMATQQYP